MSECCKKISCPWQISSIIIAVICMGVAFKDSLIALIGVLGLAGIFVIEGEAWITSRAGVLTELLSSLMALGLSLVLLNGAWNRNRRPVCIWFWITCILTVLALLTHIPDIQSMSVLKAVAYAKEVFFLCIVYGFKRRLVTPNSGHSDDSDPVELRPEAVPTPPKEFLPIGLKIQLPLTKNLNEQIP